MATPTVGTAGTAAATTGGACTPTLPASILADDIIVCWCIQCHDGTGTTATSITWPAGYTQARSVEIKDATGVSRGRAGWAWKRATGADSGTITITPVGGSTGSNSCALANCVAVRGCRTTGNPYWDETATNPNYTATVDWPAVTSFGPNDLMLLIFAHGDNVNLSTPIQFTGVVSNATSTGKQAAADVDKRSSGAGIPGIFDATSGTLGANDGTGWAAFHVSFTDGIAGGIGEGTGTGSGGATTVAATTTTAVALPCRLVAFVTWTGTGTLTGVAGGGLTWVIDATAGPTSDNKRVAIVSADAPSGIAASVAITATLSASGTARSIAVCALPELVGGASGYVQTVGSANTITGGTSWTSSTLSFTVAGKAVAVAYASQAAARTSTPVSPAVALFDLSPSSTTDQAAEVLTGSSGDATVAGTWSGVVTETLVQAVVYKTVGAAVVASDVTRDIYLEL